MHDFEHQITNSIFVIRYSNCRCFSSDIQNRALKVIYDIKNLIFGNFPNAKNVLNIEYRTNFEYRKSN